jgi:Effector-associated domain 7
MDPITAALITGAAAAGGEVVSHIVKDAYDVLKGLIQRKVAKSGSAIAAVEEDPAEKAAQDLVKKRLDEANASGDAEIVAAAAQLTAALKAAGIAMPSVSQTATGDGNVQIVGDGNSVTSNVSTGNTGINIQGSTVNGDVVHGDKVGTQINNYNTAPELSSINNAQARALVPLLNDYFSNSDIDSLCFELGIDDEQLRGQTKDEKARSLVKYVEQRGRLADLKQLMRVARPNLRDRLS